MKLAYILDTYPSPSETFIAREIEALRRRGVEVTIFASRAGAGAHPIPQPGMARLTAKATRTLRKGGKESYYKRLGAALWHDAGSRELLVNTDHIHAGWASHPAWIAWGMAEAANLPWSFSGHARDLFVEDDALTEKLQAAKFATACTRAGHARLMEALGAREKVPATQVLYIPHGIPMARYPFHDRDFASARPHTIRLLSVGRLVEKKGFYVLLQAVAKLREEGTAIEATIIGDGPLRGTLEQQRARLKLQHVVTFTGQRGEDGVIEAMREADCFVLPCVVAADGDRDGLPNVLLEAAACGLPLVTTPTGGVTDFVDSNVGRLVLPNDAAQLSHAILDVFESAGSTRNRCQAARRRVEADYDSDRNIEPLLRAFMPFDN